jgi:DNA-binding transcriptional MerR regulator
MTRHYTSGQVAKKLRISISTLKRWLDDPELSIPEQRNYNGWRLFSDKDIATLRAFKRNMRRSGKRFRENILIPVINSSVNPDNRTEK